MVSEKDIYYKYQESRAVTGDGTALLALLPDVGVTKYSMFLPVGELPGFANNPDSVEFESINMPNVGQLPGKTRLEPVEIPFLWHRDNIYRLEKYRGKVIDFLDFQPDYTCKKLKGTYRYRRDTATPGSVLQGLLTIYPISMEETTIWDCRDMVEETLCFANSIPATVEIGDTVDLSLVQSGVTPTYVFAKVDKTTGAETPDTTTFKVDTSNNKLYTVQETATQGLYAIKATANGYASWITTVYVQNNGARTFRL